MKSRVIDSLKRKQKKEKIDKTVSVAMTKMEKQQRLSSKEFLKVYDTLRQEGPTTKCQNPDTYVRNSQPANDYY